MTTGGGVVRCRSRGAAPSRRTLDASCSVPGSVVVADPVEDPRASASSFVAWRLGVTVGHRAASSSVAPDRSPANPDVKPK